MHPTNRWTGATGSEFRIKRDLAKVLGSAVARPLRRYAAYFGATESVAKEVLMAWVRLTILIIIFLASCIALGYFAEFYVRRFGLPGWILGILVFALAFLWPVTVVIYVWFDAQRYLRQHPHDDAPGLVMVSVFDVLAPILFIASFLPLLTGVAIRQRKNP